MDLLTQLDSEIDLLLKIMSSSISFISRKAIHSTLPSSSIPLTILGKTEAISEAEMDEAIAELVQDLVEKAASIKEIIQHLPTEGSLGGDKELEQDLTRMESEMKVVNTEYKEAREEVEILREEVRELVKVLSEKSQEGRRWLVSELEGKQQSQGAILAEEA